MEDVLNLGHTQVSRASRAFVRQSPFYSLDPGAAGWGWQLGNGLHLGRKSGSGKNWTTCFTLVRHLTLPDGWYMPPMYNVGFVWLNSGMTFQQGGSNMQKQPKHLTFQDREKRMLTNSFATTGFLRLLPQPDRLSCEDLTEYGTPDLASWGTRPGRTWSMVPT